MPKVIEWLSPKGLPTASTKSPISMFVAVAQLGRHQVRGVDRHHGDVGFRIAPDPRGMQLAAVGQADLDVLDVGRANDVAIGDDIVLAVDLDDAARTGLFDRLLAAITKAGGLGFFGLDVDHRRPHQLDDHFQGIALPLQTAHFAGQRFVHLGAGRVDAVRFIAVVLRSQRRGQQARNQKGQSSQVVTFAKHTIDAS